MDDCTKYNKGIFVLVKTSNPGSGDIQGIRDSENNRTTSEKVATWLSDHAKELMGTCGFSGLGAVVGATYPEEARALRTLMPTNFFLIPGYGAQGGGHGGYCDGWICKEWLRWWTRKYVPRPIYLHQCKRLE